MLKRMIITLLAVAIFVIPALAEYEVMHKEYGTVTFFGQVQARHTYVFPPEDTLPVSTFDIHRARLGAKGKVFEYGSYKVQYDVSSNSLFDAYGRLDFAPVGFELGQFKIPFGYEYLQPNGKTLTIDRAMCMQGRGGLAIAPLVPGYDIGLMLDAKFTFGDYGWVRPAFAGYNGAGRNAIDLDADKDLVFGVFANPINMEFFKGFQVFGGYAMLSPNYNEVTAYGGGAAFEHPMFTFQGEYITNIFKEVAPGTDLTMMGYYAQGSYRWYTGLDWLHAVEPLVKYDFYDADADTDYNSFNEITGGINFHFAELHRFKLQINYVMVDTEVGPGMEDPDDDRVTTQLNVYF